MNKTILGLVWGKILLLLSFCWDNEYFIDRIINIVYKKHTCSLTHHAFKIFNLNRRNSIFVRVNSAGLLSDSFVENELYRFGGINSIRGFEENSLVANLYGVINTEYRYRLSNTIYVNSVLDAAYFENDIVDSKTKLFGFGFGFGLLTKAGLFKFHSSI